MDENLNVNSQHEPWIQEIRFATKDKELLSLHSLRSLGQYEKPSGNRFKMSRQAKVNSLLA